MVRGPFYGGGRYELRYATLLDLIQTAYNVAPETVFGGPSWLAMDRFDVLAVAPAASTAKSQALMLQALLAERFRLVLHNDSRPMAAYALTVGRKPKLTEADGSGETGCNSTVESVASSGSPAPGTPSAAPVILCTCRNMNMAAFAKAMPSLQRAAPYFAKRLVVDRTELSGLWNFSFRFTAKVRADAPVAGENISIFDALEEQLGLKLEASTVPMPVIVVDSVNRKPTGNSPDAMKKFPPLPTAFEVASVKPSAPGASGSRARVDNGQLYLPQTTLETLVIVGWDIRSADQLVGAPKWMDEDRFDILAKVPAGVAVGDLAQTNRDALRPMIQSLVKERFKLEAHVENRPLNEYTLVANGPKLQKADPTVRTKWHRAPSRIPTVLRTPVLRTPAVTAPAVRTRSRPRRGWLPVKT